MKTIVLQARIKRQGCAWKDYFDYGDANNLEALDKARTDLIRRQSGGLFAEASYVKRRNWRVIIKEIIEHVIEES
jgi:hypothetical protein